MDLVESLLLAFCDSWTHPRKNSGKGKKGKGRGGRKLDDLESDDNRIEDPSREDEGDGEG